MTRRKTAPKPKAPPITPELLEATKQLIRAQAHVKIVEPVVTKYQRDILAELQFATAPENMYRGEEPYVVLDPDHAFLLSDADARLVFDLWDVAAQHSGFYGKPEQCPLLVAKTAVIDAEHAFFNASVYLHHIKEEPWNMQIRRELLDLTMKYVLAATGLTGEQVLAGMTGSFTYP